MAITPRMMLTFLVVATLCASAVAMVLPEAGRGAQVGVAIAAITGLVLSYIGLAIMLVRAYRMDEPDPEYAERIRRRTVRVHLPIMFAFPFLLIAAHPWGMATLAVGAGVFVFCHFAFLHVSIAFGLLQRRRQRRTPASS